jgi:hypothetical protein
MAADARDEEPIDDERDYQVRNRRVKSRQGRVDSKAAAW